MTGPLGNVRGEPSTAQVILMVQFPVGAGSTKAKNQHKQSLESRLKKKHKKNLRVLIPYGMSQIKKSLGNFFKRVG